MTVLSTTLCVTRITYFLVLAITKIIREVSTNNVVRMCAKVYTIKSAYNHRISSSELSYKVHIIGTNRQNDIFQKRQIYFMTCPSITSNAFSGYS